MEPREALTTMCRRCTNNEICKGTGCAPMEVLTDCIKRNNKIDIILDEHEYAYSDGMEPKGAYRTRRFTDDEYRLIHGIFGEIREALNRE